MKARTYLVAAFTLAAMLSIVILTYANADAGAVDPDQSALDKQLQDNIDAVAQYGLTCLPIQAALNVLAAEGKVPIWHGTDSFGRLFTLFQAQGGDQWTMVWLLEDGKACLAGMGFGGNLFNLTPDCPV